MPDLRPDAWGSFEESRLSGPIGEFVTSTQARVLANFAGRIHDRDILAVGPGSDRAAILFARGGAVVSAVQPTVATMARARKQADAEHLKIQFEIGNPAALRYPDRAFDVAVGLHIIPHAPDWQRCLAELCRVAERLVIIDYYSARSASLPVSVGRRLLRAVGVNTASYRVLSRRTLDEAFGGCGFSVRSIHRQFVLPLAVHQAFASRRFTQKSEKWLDRLGLLKRFGSPVLLVAERTAGR